MTLFVTEDTTAKKARELMFECFEFTGPWEKVKTEIRTAATKGEWGVKIQLTPSKSATGIYCKNIDTVYPLITGKLEKLGYNVGIETDGTFTVSWRNEGYPI